MRKKDGTVKNPTRGDRGRDGHRKKVDVSHLDKIKRDYHISGEGALSRLGQLRSLLQYIKGR